MDNIDEPILWLLLFFSTHSDLLPSDSCHNAGHY